MYTYSEEHKQFLNKFKKNKILINTFRIFIIILFIFIWELLSSYKIINTFLFSSPSNVLKTIISMVVDKSIFIHIGVTLYELVISFLLSTAVSLVISIIFWSNETIYKIFDPYITIINSLPKVALGPLIIIWCGASTNSIIFMSLLISLFVSIISIYNGFNSVNKNYITLLKSFGANKIQIFTKVIFPNNIFNIISSLKINVSMNLIGIIMGELLVSKAGIGYLIMYGSQVFNIDLVITGVFILGIISSISYFILDKFENKYLNKYK